MLNSVQLSAINDLLGNNRKMLHIKNDIVDTTEKIHELENLNKHRTQSLDTSLKAIAEKNKDLIAMYKRHQTLYNSISQISEQTHKKNQEIMRTIEAVKTYREDDKEAYAQTKEKIAQGINKNIKAVDEANKKLVKAVISTNIKCDTRDVGKAIYTRKGEEINSNFTSQIYSNLLSNNQVLKDLNAQKKNLENGLPGKHSVAQDNTYETLDRLAKELEKNSAAINTNDVTQSALQKNLMTLKMKMEDIVNEINVTTAEHTQVYQDNDSLLRKEHVRLQSKEHAKEALQTGSNQLYEAVIQELNGVTPQELFQSTHPQHVRENMNSFISIEQLLQHYPQFQKWLKNYTDNI
jgi:hypothetical protein